MKLLPDSLGTEVLLEDFTAGDILDKFVLNLNVAYQPKFLQPSGLWVFLQPYFGEDYYQNLLSSPVIIIANWHCFSPLECRLKRSQIKT